MENLTTSPSNSNKAPKVFITDDRNYPDACLLMDFEEEDEQEQEQEGSYRDMILLELIFAISASIRKGKKSVYVCPKDKRAKREVINCLRVLKVDFALDL